MSRKKDKKPFMYDVDSPESDPPVIDANTGPTPPSSNYGTNSITVSIQQPSLKQQQQPGTGGHFAANITSGGEKSSILSPASSPSGSEDDGPHCGRAEIPFGETPSGKSSRTASETRLLVPDENGVIAGEGGVVESKLVDPDTAGQITLWNGLKLKAAEFIQKERGKREIEKPPSDLFCCLRVWSILGHFGVLVCLPLLLWLLLTRTGRELELEVETSSLHALWFTTPVALTALFLGLSYLLILCEAFTARNRPYMANLMSLQEAHEYITDVRQQPPKILLKIRCYHYEENHIGKPSKRVTHEETREFHFNKCHDLSGYLRREDYPEGWVTKVKMRRVFGFLDEETEQKYKSFKNTAIDRNSYKDVCIDVEEVMEIEGLQDKISVFMDDHKPRCVDYKYYWLSAMCFLTLPYRYWFAARTMQTTFSFIKLLGD